MLVVSPGKRKRESPFIAMNFLNNLQDVRNMAQVLPMEARPGSWSRVSVKGLELHCVEEGEECWCHVRVTSIESGVVLYNLNLLNLEAHITIGTYRSTKALQEPLAKNSEFLDEIEASGGLDLEIRENPGFQETALQDQLLCFQFTIDCQGSRDLHSLEQGLSSKAAVRGLRRTPGYRAGCKGPAFHLSFRPVS